MDNNRKRTKATPNDMYATILKAVALFSGGTLPFPSDDPVGLFTRKEKLKNYLNGKVHISEREATADAHKQSYLRDNLKIISMTIQNP